MTDDMSELARRHAVTKVRAIRPGVDASTALAVIEALLVLGWRPSAAPLCATVSAEPGPPGAIPRAEGSEARSAGAGLCGYRGCERPIGHAGNHLRAVTEQFGTQVGGAR